MSVATQRYRQMTKRERSICRMAIAGLLSDIGIVKVAKKMRCSNQNVYRWMHAGWLPEKRAVDLSYHYKIQLPELRPDVWGRKW